MFTEAVRSNRIEAGRRLFHEDVVGYGALTARMRGLDDLVEHQWSPTWRRVAQWRITALDVMERSETLVAVGLCWERVNNDDHAVVHGRSTLILRCDGEQWRCVHSHFSQDPVGG
jgi:ketosteroid isomerase-like protein